MHGGAAQGAAATNDQVRLPGARLELPLSLRICEGLSMFMDPQLNALRSAHMAQLASQQRTRECLAGCLCRDMLEQGVQEQRLVLTSDRGVMAMRDSAHVLLVETNEKRGQLAEVVQALDIQLSPRDIMSRCTACGGALIDRPFAFEELPAASIETFTKQGTLDGLREAVSKFWVCARCSKAFWKGGQYANAMRQLTARCEQMGEAMRISGRADSSLAQAEAVCEHGMD